MLRLAGEQVELLFDEVLPVEVCEWPEQLARLDELLGDQVLLAPIEAGWEVSARNHGRPAIPMTSYVRLMVIKQRPDGATDVKCGVGWTRQFRAAPCRAEQERAGLILSAAAIATSFFGGAALDRGTTALTWIAIALFLALGAAVIRILWPRRDWEFTIGPGALIENYIEHPEPLTLPLIHRDLALHMDRSYFHNRGELLLLVRYFRVASVLLTLEVVAWVVDLVIQA